MENYSLLPAILSFIFVVGLLLATLWFLKSRSLGNLGLSGKSAVILEVCRIDAKHKLLVINYADRRLLLGVSPNQITLLDNQPESDMPTVAEDGVRASVGFKQQLQSLLARDKESR